MKKLGDYFERRANDEGKTTVHLVDGAPEWLHNAIMEAHHGSFPDDWVYQECEAACGAYDDGYLTEDRLHEHVDSRVEIYTKKLAQWAADLCLTSLFSEAEDCADDLGTGGKLADYLQRVQYCAIELIVSTMLREIQANYNEDEEEDV